MNRSSVATPRPAAMTGARRKTRRWPRGWPANSPRRSACSTPSTLAWRARAGLDDAALPRRRRDPDGGARRRASSGTAASAAWRPGRDAGPYLALPPRCPGPAGPTCWRSSASPPGGRPADGWGPPCPERALRAWGQSVADDLRGEAFPRAAAAGRPRAGRGGRAAPDRPADPPDADLGRPRDVPGAGAEGRPLDAPGRGRRLGPQRRRRADRRRGRGRRDAPATTSAA